MFRYISYLMGHIGGPRGEVGRHIDQLWKAAVDGVPLVGGGVLLVLRVQPHLVRVLCQQRAASGGRLW